MLNQRAFPLSILMMTIFVFISLTCPDSASTNTTNPYEGFPKIIPQINDFTGAVTQSIPIKVPPGRNSLQPELQFTYNSYIKNGWLGIGWDIPIGAIQRQTSKCVQYDQDDYVLLRNGHKDRLVHVGNDYYREKIETEFSKYRLHRTSDGDYWVITMKDGAKFYFGHESGALSRQITSFGTFKWCLDRVEDTNGNYMTIRYIENQGQLYPKQIDYTGNSITGDLPTNKVVFEYDETRQDFWKNYESKAETVTALRLEYVKTFADTDQPALTYRLIYSDSPSSRQSMLQRIRIIGSDGITELPSYSFGYKEGQEGSLGGVIGRTDAIDWIQVADVNGDNKEDIIKLSSWRGSGPICGILYSKGDGTFEQGPVSTFGDFNASTYPYTMIRPYFADLDNDGFLDVIVQTVGKEFIADEDNAMKYVERLFQGINDGSGSFSPSFHSIILEQGNQDPESIEPKFIALSDVNYDGNIDIIIAENLGEESSRALFNDGQGDFSNGGNIDLPNPGYSQGRYFADVNGDGYDDIIDYLYDSSDRKTELRTILNKGNGTYIRVTKTSFFNNIEGTVAFRDVNNDNKADFVVTTAESGSSKPVSLDTYISTGTGEYIHSSSREINYQHGDKPNKYHIYGDLNGDNVLDIVYCAFYLDEFDIIESSIYSFQLSQNTSPFFDLLDVANSPIGATMEYEYIQSSSQEDHYLLPFILYPVKSANVDDNVSIASSTDTYIFQKGYYDPDEREFRGFGKTTITHPDNSVTIKQHYVGLGDNTDKNPDNYYFRGRIKQVDKYASEGGALLLSTTYSWENVESATHPWAFVKLVQERTELYDGQMVFTQNNYIYDDANGNLKQHIATGTDAEKIIKEYDYLNYTGDEWDPIWRRTSETLFFANDPSNLARHVAYNHDPVNGNLTDKTLVNHDIGGSDSVYSYEYFPNGNLHYEYDPNNNRTEFLYESTQTYIETIINPRLHETTQTWDHRWGLRLTITDPNQQTTTNYYDEFGRLYQTDYPDGGQTTIEFNDYCQDEACVFSSPRKVVKRVRTLGSTTRDTVYYYDGLGREIQTVTTGEGPNFFVNKRHYNNMGLKYYEAGPFFWTTDEFLDWESYVVSGGNYPIGEYPYVRTDFDIRSRPTLVSSQDGQNGVLQTIYQYSGFSTTTIDPDNCSKTKTVDHLGRTIHVIDHAEDLDINTRYLYNAAGDLLETRNHYWSESDPDANRVKMQYNSLGRKRYMDDPDMGEWTYDYDPNGNIELQTDAKGNRIQFDYDELNRLVLKTYLDTAEPSVSYKHDEATVINGIGRLYESTNGNVTTRHLAYDEMGRLKEMNKTILGQALRTTLYSYDYNGKIERLTYPHTDASPQFYVEYDYYPGTSLLNTVTGSNGTEFARLSDYKPSTKIGRMDLGNGAFTQYAYDDWTQRLTGIYTESSVGSEIQNRNYVYSPAGDIKVIDDKGNNETFTYTYDKLHRLVSETSSTGSLGVIPAILEMQYEDADHIHAVSSVIYKGNRHSYAYDPNGNLKLGPDLTDPTAIVERSLTYNADNMPETIVHPTGGTINLVYDEAARRAKKVAAGKETYYFSNEFELIDNVETFYIFAGNQRVAMLKNGQPVYFHKDHLGSSTAITDYEGKKLETAQYMPFGGKRGSENDISVSDYKFTDQELDSESGLYNYHARLYDPIIGRFASADPIIQAPEYSQSFNRYAYCFNNPLIYIDPTGYMGDSSEGGDPDGGDPDGGNPDDQGPTDVSDESDPPPDSETVISEKEIPFNKDIPGWARGRTLVTERIYSKKYSRTFDIGNIKDESQTNSGIGNPGSRGYTGPPDLPLPMPVLSPVDIVAGFYGIARAGVVGISRFGLRGLRGIASKSATKLLNAPINITQKGLKHVVDRHTVNKIAKFANKSKFNAGEDLSGLIRSGTQQRAVQQLNGNLARTFDVGRNIGVNRATGGQTSVMTIITRPNGDLVTAFPGAP